MTDFFNFYPAGGAKTVTNIPAADVNSANKADKFGCIETADGLYVPAMKSDWEPNLGPSDVLIDF